MPRRRHDNPSRSVHNHVAEPRRAKSRQIAKMFYERQVQKDHEIGVHPQFRNGAARYQSVAAWEKASREWDRAHPL